MLYFVYMCVDIFGLGDFRGRSCLASKLLDRLSLDSTALSINASLHTDMPLRMDVLQRLISQPLSKRPVPANGLLYAQAIDAIDVRAVDLL